MPLGLKVGLGPGDFVLDGDLAPLPKRGRSPLPTFRPTSIVAKRLGGPRWHLARKWANIVLDGDPTPSRKMGLQPPPRFSTYFYCGQTVGCIKMPLSMEVSLSPGDFVLDGDSDPSQKRAEPLILGPCLLCQRLDASRCHLVRR